MIFRFVIMIRDELASRHNSGTIILCVTVNSGFIKKINLEKQGWPAGLIDLVLRFNVFTIKP